MINKTGIYKIVNKINNKVYYGSASNSFKKRWKVHKSNLNKNKHMNKHLQDAWNLYGAEHFDFSIVLLCSPENCLFYEQLFLDKYWDNCKECYNIVPTAGSSLGRPCPPETREKLSKANKGKVPHNKGKPHSIETRKKSGDVHRGKVLTIEHKKKISDALRGRKHSNETRQKISAGNKRKIISTEAREKLRLARLGKRRIK